MSTQTMQQTIANYFKTQPIQRAWLFGSYARGDDRENFFQKLFGHLHKSSYLCTAVPVVPLPDIQVLVMNPGFFMPFCLMVAKVRKIFQIISSYSRFLRDRCENNEREAEADGCRHGFPLIEVLFLCR